jgi:transposase-like protein
LFSARRYPDDIRSQAVAAVDSRRLQDPADRSIFREVAEQFKIGEQSLRLWVKKQDSDSSKIQPTDSFVQSGPGDGAENELAQVRLEAEVRTLRKKIEKLQVENDLLKRAFVVFSSEWEK